MPKSRGRPRPEAKRKKGRARSSADRRQHQPIYRRARNLADLLDEHYQSDDFMRDVHGVLANINLPTRYNSSDAIRAVEPRLLAALDASCSELTAYWTLPALHQFVVDHYSAKSRASRARRVHFAPYKLLASRVFALRLTASPPTWPTPHAALRRALATAFLYDQIVRFRFVLAVDSGSELVVTTEGFEPNEAAQAVAHGMAIAYADGGAVQRFANRTTEMMFRRPGVFLNRTVRGMVRVAATAAA